MPRYDTLTIRDYRLLENTVPVRNRPPRENTESLQNYENLSADVKLNWSGDFIFDDKTQDLLLTQTVESYAQSIYHRLVTQRGEFPFDSNFGWDFHYLYQMNVVEQRQILPRVVRDVRDAVQLDEDTLSVINVTAFIERMDQQSHNIIVEVTARPRSIENNVQIVFELDATPEEG